MTVGAGASTGQNQSPKNVKHYNLTSPVTPNTEFSQALSRSVKMLIIKTRNNDAAFKVYYDNTGTPPYTSRPKGCGYLVKDVNYDGQIVFLQCSEASKEFEIEEWT